MNISQTILNLFEQHDCVIVPNLGGFVANAQSSRLNTQTNEITPPSKQIVFNPHLLHDDGLLIGAVSKNGNIPYQEAKEIIESYVKNLNEILEKNERFELPQIGILYLKNEKLLFSSNSFEGIRNDAFGLKTIRLNKISKTKELDQNVFQEKILALENNIKLLQETNHKKSSNPFWGIAASIIPLAMISGFLLAKFIPQGNMNEVMASFFSASEPNKSVISSTEVKPKNENSRSHTFKFDSLKQEVVKEVFEEINAIEDNKKVENDNQTPHESVDNLENSYHLIVGVFSSKNNALKKIKKLSKDGIEAKIYDSLNGKHRVVSSSFNSRLSAKKASKVLKQSGVSNWILKN